MNVPVKQSIISHIAQYYSDDYKAKAPAVSKTFNLKHIYKHTIDVPTAQELEVFSLRLYIYFSNTLFFSPYYSLSATTGISIVCESAISGSRRDCSLRWWRSCGSPTTSPPSPSTTPAPPERAPWLLLMPFRPIRT